MMSGEIEGARVLAVGAEVRMPEGVYRVVPGGSFDALGAARAGLERLAVMHGAAVFELLPDYEDEDPRPGALLRVRDAWMVATLGAVEVGVAPTSAGESWRVITLLADEMQDAGEATCAGGVVRAGEDGGWVGEASRVRRHSLRVDRSLRDWGWSWGRSTIGPGMLTVRVERGREEIARFLDGYAPLPYMRAADDCYRVPEVHGLRSLREIRIFDGGLTLMRDYHEPPEALVMVDAGLLAALTDGAFGELVWDVIEGDWGAYMATGHSRASLAAYLDAAVDAAGLKAEYAAAFVMRRVDASAARTQAEVIAAVSRLLGAAEDVADGAFDAWLAGLPISAVPRKIEVTVAPAFAERHGVQWFFDRVFAAQPRVSWSIRRG